MKPLLCKLSIHTPFTQFIELFGKGLIYFECDRCDYLWF